MVGISSQVSNALSGALLILVVIGRSASLNRSLLRSVFQRYRLRWSASPASHNSH
jgi:AI-2 transport system permease protein